MLMPSRTFLVALLTLFALVAACVEKRDDDDSCPAPTAARATCVSGQQVACPCADGTTSVQACAPGGYFNACQCAAPDAGADAGADADADAGDGG